MEFYILDLSSNIISMANNSKHDQPVLNKRLLLQVGTITSHP